MTIFNALVNHVLLASTSLTSSVSIISFSLLSPAKFFVVDTTMLATIEPRSLDSPPTEDVRPESENDQRDEERAFGSSSATPFSLPLGGRQASGSDETELQTRSNTSVGTSTNFIKRKTSQLLEAISPASRAHVDAPLPQKLAALVDAFRGSDIATDLQQEIRDAETHANQQQALPDVALENSLTRGRQRASWATQFTILSGRAFKNLYRDPALLAAHYLSAIIVAGVYIRHIPS